MKETKNTTPAFQAFGIITTLFLFLLLPGCTNAPLSEVETPNKEEKAEVAKEIIWHIKAIHPEGRTLDVKALDKDGNIYDVKAIQDADQRQFMDIKALFGEKKLPVKVLVSDDEYAPVKAIGEDGTIYDIKALPPGGDILDVKGVRHAGNIIPHQGDQQRG